jgi:hypothetical protein
VNCRPLRPGSHYNNALRPNTPDSHAIALKRITDRVHARISAAALADPRFILNLRSGRYDARERSS